MHQKPRILLVEDEPLITLLYEDIFLDSDFHLEEALDCNKQALRHLTEYRPDVAIVDFLLPDGHCGPIVEVLVAMNVPVLVVSGDAAGLEQAKAWGVPSLAKPFSENALLSAVKALAS